jgi:hypothetical protein
VKPISPQSSRLRNLLKNALNFAALVIGLGAGIAQLGNFPQGFGRLVLKVVSVTSILFLAIRTWHIYFVSRNQQLRKDLERSENLLEIQRTNHQGYMAAIERIIDREVPLFQDTLEVTVVVGNNDDTDLIFERWHTIPQPRVTHRSVRPILPMNEERIVRLEDIGFRSRLLNATGNITQLPLIEKINYLRVWLVFHPALTATTDWTVEYRPKGLWRPLRQRGWDYLRWNDSLPTDNDAPSSLTRFTVRFVFPKSSMAPGVSERNNLGQLDSPTRIAGTEQWVVVWRDPHPDGRRYEWDLTYPGDNSSGS